MAGVEGHTRSVMEELRRTVDIGGDREGGARGAALDTESAAVEPGQVGAFGWDPGNLWKLGLEQLPEQSPIGGEPCQQVVEPLGPFPKGGAVRQDPQMTWCLIDLCWD